MNSTDILSQRIDFIAIISVDGANPNGDPLGGNVPRTDYAGHGIISDVCIKHKLRNRLAAAMELEKGAHLVSEILISPASTTDRADSIEEKLALATVEYQGEKTAVGKVLQHKDISVRDKAAALCTAFRDVRLFGFVAGSNATPDASGRTVGVTGPVSLTDARSIAPLCVSQQQITKCIRSAKERKAGSGMDTMGMKYRVERAAYVLKGGISAYDAERTGLTWADVDALKDALKDMFATDASSDRPAGSMSVQQIYWFTHDSKLGKIPRQKIFDAITITPKEEYPFYEADIAHGILANSSVHMEALL